MLLKLYPKVHRRYTSLPILGPILDAFGTWLLKQDYATDCVREHFCTARRLTRTLEEQGIHNLARLTRARLRACAPANRLDDRRLYATVRLLERYAVRFVAQDNWRSPRPPQFGEHLRLPPVGHRRFARGGVIVPGGRGGSDGTGERAMKTPRAFTSPLASDIVRYLTIKQGWDESTMASVACSLTSTSS
jgi:hypothetical protein